MRTLAGRILAVVCFSGLTCALPLLQPNAPSQWKQYSYAADGFSVSAPQLPVLQVAETPTSSGKVTTRNYAIDLGNNSGVMISSADIPGADRNPTKDVLRNAKNGAAGAVKATISSEKDIALDGYPGVEFEAANQQFHARCRIFIVKSRLFTVMVIAPLGTPTPADGVRIVDSFKLAPATGPAH
jgi:hypothetical protein